MDELVRALICGAAAWRVASLFAFEMGPFDIFAHVRRWLGADGDPHTGEITAFLAKLIICTWCATVWFVPLFWFAWELSPVIPGVFAAMAVAVTLETYNR